MSVNYYAAPLGLLTQPSEKTNEDFGSRLPPFISVDPTASQRYKLMIS